MSFRLRTVAVGLIALAATGCGTRVGTGGGASTSSPGHGPIAVATVIGQKPTSSAGANPVTVTVRSGADVILSGKDSDGTDAAIDSFTWTQTGGQQLPAAPDINALLYRSSNTVSFHAPLVAPGAAPLTFRLTVKDARSVTATADVSVTVVPPGDQNQMLVVPEVTQRFTIAVLTTDGFGGQPLANDIPVCVQLLRTINYRTRNLGTTSPEQAAAPVPLAPLTIDTSWRALTTVAAAGSGSDSVQLNAAAASFSNPRVTFDVPSLNDEDLFARYNQPGAGNNFDLQLVPSDVDTAQLQVAVSATAGTCAQPAGANTASPMIVALLGADGGVKLSSKASTGSSILNQDANSTALTADTLLTTINPTQVVNGQSAPYARGPVETAASADAYYAAIDPGSTKTTLTTWLSANCFDPAAADYGVGAAGAGNGAHATYTNNFDLGFGRDMYFIRCSADHMDPVTHAVTAHAGDMASVVINYPSLEQTALKQSPIIAVAMEYSAAAGGYNPTRKFSKFYIFAPNDRTGEFVRVRSANFDRRGQKYLPGSCTACHAANLPSLPITFSGPAANTKCDATSYPVNACYRLVQDPTDSQHTCNADSVPGTPGCLPPGDIGSAFLPWDVDAFLFSDNDPAFTGHLVPGGSYTRGMQEPALKVLNKLAYSTYKYGTDTSGADITETVIPTGSPTTGAQAVDRYGAVKTMIEHWYGDGGTNFPQATFTDYTDAAPPAGWQSQPASAPLYHTVFARNCRTCHVVNADPGLQFSGLMESQLQANQLKDGYAKFMDEFATTTAGPNKGVLYLTQQGIMPFARLTLDRFWVDFDNGTSSGNTLAQALQMQAALAGQPVINATIQPSNKPLQPGQTASATTSSSARVDATASDFVAKFNWSLSVTPLPASDNDTSKPPVCSTSSAGAAVAVVGDTTASPGFYVGKSGLYRITLTPDNGVGQSGSASSYEYDICAANFVPTWTPAASPSCTAVKAPYQSSGAGGQQALPLNSCFAGAGNPPYSLKLSSDAQNYGLSASGPVVAPNGPTWNAAVLCDGLLATGPCATVPSAQFNFNANASPTSAVPVYYQLCDVDNDCTATGTGTTSSAVLSVAPTSVSIANASLKMYWAPCLDSYIDDVTNHATHCHNPGNLGSAFSGQLSGNYQLILGQNPSTSAPPGASMSHLYDAMTLGGAGNALQVSIVPPSMTAFGGMALPLQDSAVNLQSDLAQVLLVPASAYTNYSGQSLPFVTSDINGLSLTDGASAAALPALSYTLTAVGTGNGTTACNGNFSAGSSTCANGTLNIQALTSFTRSTASQTQPIFGTPAKNGNPAVTGIMASCSGSTCHSGTGNVWTYVPGDSQTTYNNICNSGSGAGTTHNCANPVKDASNNAIIVPGAPESSIFYTAACTTGFGTGPSRMITAFPSPAATQCQIIYQWILEGAAND